MMVVAGAIAALRRPTLARTVARELRVHFRGNAALRSQRRPRFRRVLDLARRRPVAVAFCIVAVYALVVGSTFLVSPAALGLKVPANVNDYFRDFQGIATALLGTQATLVALVYPLTIALVGTLFEARTTTGSRLNVFLTETEAVATGGSALLLCMVTGLPLVAFGQMPLRVTAALTALDALWFAFNLFGVAYFVRRSLDYLRPTSRVTLLREYAANVAWRADLTQLMRRDRLARATTYGYIYPGPNAKARGGTEPDLVQVGLADRQPDGHEAAIDLGDKCVLTDVRLGLLDVVARSWAARTAIALPVSGGKSRHPVLTYAAIGGGSGREVLGSVSGGASLDALETFLVRRAYRFQRAGRVCGVAPLETERLLREAAADLPPLVQQGKLSEFEAQLEQVVALHAFLFEAAQRRGDRAMLSYALDRDPGGFDTVAQLWTRCYRDLLVRAAAELRKEASFFRWCAYLPHRLLFVIRETVPRPLVLSSLELARTLFWVLRQWADGARPIQASRAVANEGWEIAGSDGQIYEGAWRELVAGMEQLADGLGRPCLGEQEGVTWESAASPARSQLQHLGECFVMVGACAWAGDLTGTRWSVDMLLRWPKASLNRLDGNGSGVVMAEALLHPGLFGTPWEELAPLRATAQMQAFAPDAHQVLHALLRNAWFDAQVMLTCVLVRRAVQAGPLSAQAEAARRLIWRDAYDQVGSLDPGDESVTPSKFLLSLLRIVSSGYGIQGTWAATLRDWADRLTHAVRGPMVSQRIYSTSGPLLDIGNFTMEQAVCLAALVHPPGGAGADLREALAAASALDDDARRVEGFLEDLLGAVDRLDPAVHEPLASSFHPPNAACRFEDGRAGARELVARCLATVAETRAARLRAAPIDHGRLQAIAEAANATAFVPALAALPVSLFSEVVLVPEALAEYVWHDDQERGLLTDPPMAHPVSNEREWWSDSARNWVAAVVWSDVLGQAGVDIRTATDAGEFWSMVEGAARPILDQGLTPMLLVGPAIHRRWLGEWELAAGIGDRSRLPASLNYVPVQRAAETRPFAHLNGIAAYAAPTLLGREARSYVLPHELLDRLELTEQAPAQAVKVAIGNDDAANATVRLDVAFACRVILGPGRIIAIVAPSRPPPS